MIVKKIKGFLALFFLGPAYLSASQQQVAENENKLPTIKEQLNQRTENLEKNQPKV